MEVKLFAQDADYWDTTVPLRKSIADIDHLIMERCGETGKKITEVDGLPVLEIWWRMDGMDYIAIFRCLKLANRRTTTKTTNLATRQANQMGRIAWWWMKSALLMHDYGNQEVLLPYLMLPAKSPDGKRFTTTLQQQGVEWMLGSISTLPALPPPSAEFKEV